MDSLCAAFDLARFGVDNGGQAGDGLHQPLASFQPVGLLIACQVGFLGQLFQLRSAGIGADTGNLVVNTQMDLSISTTQAYISTTSASETTTTAQELCQEA